MTSEDTKWRRVDQEWERVMRRLRKKAIQESANDGALSEKDADFYRIVLRLTDEQQN
jgi:histone deacetylase complex regulatory component SIN3